MGESTRVSRNPFGIKHLWDGRHKDGLVAARSPTGIGSPALVGLTGKAQSPKLLRAPRVDAKSAHFETSSGSTQQNTTRGQSSAHTTPVSAAVSVNDAGSQGSDWPARIRAPQTGLLLLAINDGDTVVSSGKEPGSSDDELDLNEQDTPVTGFAVASNRRNADFHQLFPYVPVGDHLIEDYGCALQREILIQGRLYVSENHICFHANIFGWITDLSFPMYEITEVEKMTAFVIPNAIQIATRQAKHTFVSFLSRDTTYDVIANVWRLTHPDDHLELDSRNAPTWVMASMASGVSKWSKKEGSVAGASNNASIRDMISTTSSVSGWSWKARSVAEASNNASIRDVASIIPSVSEWSEKEDVAKASSISHFAHSKGDHLSELVLESVFPGTLEKMYNLMFVSGFMSYFMEVDQKLSDVQISGWMPIGQGSKLVQRSVSYIKPLNHNMGPKQTKYEIHDEAVHCDFEDQVVMLTTTHTPDLPSGRAFVVKTRTCLIWASAITTRVIVTTQVEWTGKSFIKNLIEKSVIEGQKAYHSDLDKAMRMYIQEHQAEFFPEGLDPSAVAPAGPITSLADANGVGRRLSAEEVRDGSQWVYDTLDGAYCAAKRSTKGALELVKEAWEQSSSTTILWFVIVLLMLSNVWSLVLIGNREEVGRRKELKRGEEEERWLQGMIAGVWGELAAECTRVSGGVMVPLMTMPVEEVHVEVANLDKMLDAVEQRLQMIRESLEGLS